MAKRAKSAPGKRPCGPESARRIAKRAKAAPGKRPCGPDSARRAPRQARKAPVRAGKRPGCGRLHQQAEESTARHEISDTLKCCKTRFASGDALIMLGRRPGVRGNRRGRRLERTRAGQSAPGEWQLKRHLESARAGQEAPREWPSAPKQRPESARAGQKAPGERPSKPGKRPCGSERARRMAT